MTQNSRQRSVQIQWQSWSAKRCSLSSLTTLVNVAASPAPTAAVSCASSAECARSYCVAAANANASATSSVAAIDGLA